MLEKDTLSRVLYIDVTNKKYWVEDRSDLFSKFFGGTGVGIKLLQEECPPGVDPFAPENPIIFVTGPMVGAYPLASKTVAIFKSPHTGDLGESHAGGRSSVAIRLAGYGAIVIKGASDIPIYISIQGNKVFFRDASTLWGMSSSLTPAKVIREREPGSGYRSILRIGPAGENLVSFASVTAETYRHFGRMGLGAVFGSKKLKAVVISGKQTIMVSDKKLYRQVYNKIYNSATSSEIMKKYHDIGTPINVNTLNLLKALPTKNLQLAHFDQAETLTGEYIAENFLGRRVACAHCPVACIHLANLRENYKDSPYFYKTTSVGYDFEIIFALGSMLGIHKPNDLFILTEDVEKYCMDAMSSGVIMAWVTEMMEKKLINTKDTAGVVVTWGDLQGYREMLKNLVNQINPFYKALAKGVVYASEQYGGKEFALAYNKNEMPGYHTGPAAHLGYLIGARHSHLCNAGYSVDQTKLMDNVLEPEKVIDLLIEEESYRQILSSMVVCFFARGIYNYDTLTQGLSVLGFDADEAKLKEIGKQIHAEKFRFKFREGFSFDNINLPKRIFETPDPTGKLTKEYMRKAIAYVSKILKPE
jgi:aldehyde:ferredoxin oxidoreductase